MYFGGKFYNYGNGNTDVVIKRRKGAMETMHIPAQVAAEGALGDFVMDTEGKRLVVGEPSPDSALTYVLTDDFGFTYMHDLRATIIMCSDAVLFEMTSGVIYLKDDKGEPFAVDEKGNVKRNLSDDVKQHIVWCKFNSFMEQRNAMCRSLYNLGSRDAEGYTMNLAFDMIFSVSGADASRVTTYKLAYGPSSLMDISNGGFVFRDYTPVPDDEGAPEDDIVGFGNDSDDEDSVDDDEDEDFELLDD